MLNEVDITVFTFIGITMISMMMDTPMKKARDNGISAFGNPKEVNPQVLIPIMGTPALILGVLS